MDLWAYVGRTPGRDGAHRGRVKCTCGHQPAPPCTRHRLRTRATQAPSIPPVPKSLAFVTPPSPVLLSSALTPRLDPSDDFTPSAPTRLSAQLSAPTLSAALLACAPAGAYLDELQHLEAWDPSQESSLPAIDEHSAAEDQRLPPVSAAGLGGGSSSLGASGNGNGGGRSDWGGVGPSSSSAGEGPGPAVPVGGLQRALAGPFSNHSAEDFSAAVAESLAQQSAAGSAPASWQGSRPASEQGDLPIAPAVSLGAAAQQQQQHASQPSTPTMGRSQQQLQHGYPPSPSFGGGSGGRGRNGSSTPRAQQAQQQQQFWRGNGAGGGGMEAGLPGSPMHPGLFSASGMGQMGQMSPGQASYGVVPIPHMIPMLHPMQMQYPGSGYSMQYPGGGMAVPMQYPHAMQAPVQMQPQLVAQPGGGWVPMQHAYYAGDMAGAQMQQPQQGRGRGGL